MAELLFFIGWLIDLYIWIIIIQAVLSWLVAFNVINTRNQLVYAIGNGLYRVTEPVLGRIRRVLPAMGGIDFSPLLAIVVLLFIKNVVILGWMMGPVRSF